MTHKNEKSFIDAYVVCALWSSNTDDGQPLDDDFDGSCIAESSMQSMRADCVRFTTEQRAVLDYVDSTGEHGNTYAMAGHDFWLTRNGHGAGFWDGDWNIDLPAPDGGFSAQAGDVLTDAARRFGTSDMYVGDDGKLYVTPEVK